MIALLALGAAPAPKWTCSRPITTMWRAPPRQTTRRPSRGWSPARRYRANNVDDSGRTGLQIAAANGNLQIAAILIKAGANVNQKDRLGNTALHVATERNQTEMAELLIDVGADLNSENRDGMTPLMIAARQRQCRSCQGAARERSGRPQDRLYRP